MRLPVHPPVAAFSCSSAARVLAIRPPPRLKRRDRARARARAAAGRGAARAGAPRARRARWARRRRAAAAAAGTTSSLPRRVVGLRSVSPPAHPVGCLFSDVKCVQVITLSGGAELPRGPLSETSTARGAGGYQFGARPSGPCLRKIRSPRPRFGDRRCRRRRRRDALEAPAAPPSASCAARAWSRMPCATVAFHKSEADGPPMLPFQPGRAHAEPSRRGRALGVVPKVRERHNQLRLEIPCTGMPSKSRLEP